MPRIYEYKKYLASGELTFLEQYESSINELYANLEKDGLLNNTFTDSQIQRIVNLSFTTHFASHLHSNFNKILTSDIKKNEENIEKLRQLGLRVDTIGNQYCTVMCHMYQVSAERLKLHFATLINFALLGITDADKKPLGLLIGKLKIKYPENNFIKYMNTKIRNAVTHYSYFFENSKIQLCDGYFDPNPVSIELHEFMKEVKNINILTETFFIIYLDKYRPGNTIHIGI